MWTSLILRSPLTRSGTPRRYTYDCPTPALATSSPFRCTGALGAVHRGRALDADSARAAVFQPDGDVDLHCGAKCVCYAVWIDMSVMADVLEHRLGHAVHRPLELAATLDLSTPAGRTWAGLIRLLVSWPVLRHPLLADRARETVADRLLLAVDHPYREDLDAPDHSWGPGPVKRMVDAVEAFPQYPFTLTELADLSGVSVRALHESCRRDLDVSPAEQAAQRPAGSGVPRARGHRGRTGHRRRIHLDGDSRIRRVSPQTTQIDMVYRPGRRSADLPTPEQTTPARPHRTSRRTPPVRASRAHATGRAFERWITLTFFFFFFFFFAAPPSVSATPVSAPRVGQCGVAVNAQCPETVWCRRGRVSAHRLLTVVDLADDGVVVVADDAGCGNAPPAGCGRGLGRLGDGVVGVVMVPGQSRPVSVIGDAGGFLVDDRGLAGERGGQGVDGEVVHRARVAAGGVVDQGDGVGAEQGVASGRRS